MEKFSIVFDTSKTCLNYDEFLPNQVFTLPGGAYMSTHLDDDGGHRVSINLESLLGRRYKIVLNAKAHKNRHASVSPKRSATSDYGSKRKKKMRLKKKHNIYDEYSSAQVANTVGGNGFNRFANNITSSNSYNSSADSKAIADHQRRRTLQENKDPEYILKKLFDCKKSCAICHLSHENISEIQKCTSCGVEVHELCYGIHEKDISKEIGWKCLPCMKGLKVFPTSVAIKSNENGANSKEEEGNETELLKCVFCLRSGGAMKQTIENTWAHMSCALRIDSCTFLDKENMNLVGLTDEYGQRIEYMEEYIHRQSFEHNPVTVGNVDTTSSVDQEANVIDERKTKCSICKSVKGLKIKCAVVGCDEYFHGSCLTPHNSLSFTTVKSGRVVMNTLCPYHFQTAVEKTILSPSKSIENLYSRNNNGNAKLLHDSHRKRSSSSIKKRKSSSSANKNPNIPESLQSISNRKTSKYKHDKKEFYKALYRFHPKQRSGTSVMDKPPILAHIDLDLYNFFILVLKCGGFDTVVRYEGTWSKIFQALPNYSKTETSASYRLKRIYQKFLLSYEQHIIINGAINVQTHIGRTLIEYVEGDYEQANAHRDEGDEDEESSEEESSEEESSEEESSEEEESEDEESEEEEEEESEGEEEAKVGNYNKINRQLNSLSTNISATNQNASNVSIDGFVLTEL